MYNPWFDAAVLASRACNVVFLRSLKLAAGGLAAQEESQRMVSEKLMAHAQAAATLMTGGSLETVIAGYRAVVDANAERLTIP